MGEIIFAGRERPVRSTPMRIVIWLSPLWLGVLLLSIEHDPGHADRPDLPDVQPAVVGEPALLQETSRDDPVPLLPDTGGMNPAGRSRGPAGEADAPALPPAPTGETRPTQADGDDPASRLAEIPAAGQDGRRAETGGRATLATGPRAEAAPVRTAIPAGSDPVYRWQRPADDGSVASLDPGGAAKGP